MAADSAWFAQDAVADKTCLDTFYATETGRLIKQHADTHPDMSRLVQRLANGCALDMLAEIKEGKNEGMEKVVHLGPALVPRLLTF